MNTQFEWIVHELQVAPSLDGLQNVVRKIAWEAQARAETAFVREQGVVELSEPASGKFIDYESVDEQTVLQWLWSSVDKQSVEEKMSAELNAQLKPALVSLPLPWQQ